MDHFKQAGFEPNIIFKSSHDLNIAYELVALNKGIFIFINGLTSISQYSSITSIPIDVPTAYWDVGIIIKNNIKITDPYD